MIAEILFIFAFLMLFYIYFGYPLVIFIISTLKKRKLTFNNKYEPFVTIIISAYNEEDSIAKKIENTVNLDYPKTKREIIVVSDASTDKTDEIVEYFSKEGVRLLRIEGRQGKTKGQNEAVKVARGEIIIFTDAKAIFDKEVIKLMVRDLSDESIGVVAGKIAYGNDLAQANEGAYIKYEQIVRSLESRLNSTICVSGAIYALRKNEYVVLEPEAQSDLVEPVSVFLKYGKAIHFEPNAKCVAQASGSSRGEFKRHERIITRYLFSRKLIKDAFSLRRNALFAFEIYSHKTLRFEAPIFMLTLLMANIYLSSNNMMWAIILVGQLMFYLLGVVGMIWEKSGQANYILSLPYHFLVLNLAAAKSWVNFLRGKNFVTWNLKGN